jgi:di/tricarboxylate transporter
VAIFIPVVISVAGRMQCSPSKLLMPLSFASMFGGVCTLLGTSTNILVSSIAQAHGQAPFGMFEFLPLGIVFFAVGFVYLFFFGTRLLPARRRPENLGDVFEMRPFVTEVEITGDFAHRDQPLSESDFLRDLDLDVVGVRSQAGEKIDDPRDTELRPGQILRLRGDAGEIRKLLERENLQLRTRGEDERIDLEEGRATLVEAVIAPDGALPNQRIADVDFLEEYGAVLLAIRHRGELSHSDMQQIRLSGGDSLLLLVREEHLAALERDRSFVIATELKVTAPRRERLPIALAVLAGIVIATAAGVSPIEVNAVTGAVLLVVTGCLTNQEAYKSVDWKVVLLLAGIIPLGLAMEKTGAAELIAVQIRTLLGPWGPTAVLSGFFLATMLLTAVISNQATAALLAPVAIQAAGALEVDPRPMLMAVTFAASLSFITPVGYQTNTLVYGPGHYRFLDYTRVGLPLNLAFWLLATLLIPLFWPF